MQETTRVPAQELERLLRQEADRGRNAALIVDHAQRLARLCLARDGEKEVPAAWPVHPARAQDEMSAAALDDRALAGELGAAVDAERIRRIVFDVSTTLRAVEDIVGGVVNEPRTDPLRFLGEHARGRTVHSHGEL